MGLTDWIETSIGKSRFKEEKVFVAKSLFSIEPKAAFRQPKTDRLIIGRFLEDSATDNRFDEAKIDAGHQILVKWADLEKTGKLARLNETQMQGDFLAEVFGQALEYAGPTDGADIWHREQHYHIAGQEPDAVLGVFKQGTDHSPLADRRNPPRRARSHGRVVHRSLTFIERFCRVVSNFFPNAQHGGVDKSTNKVKFAAVQAELPKLYSQGVCYADTNDFNQHVNGTLGGTYNLSDTLESKDKIAIFNGASQTATVTIVSSIDGNPASVQTIGTFTVAT